MRRLLVLTLCLLTACGSDDEVTRGEGGTLQLGGNEARQVTERSFRLDGRALVFDLDNGTVTVVGTDVDEAELRIERVARGSSSSTAAKRLDRMSVEEVGDSEIYQVVLRGDDGEGEFNVEARVPLATALNIDVENGTVRLSGTTGEISAQSENGSVEAAGLAGLRVELGTRRGNVAAGFAALPAEADVRLETENGNVTVTLPATADATVEAETETGTIAVDGLTFANRDLDRDGAGQAFRGRLGRGTADVRATTDLGTIRLEAGTPRTLVALAT